MAKNLSGLAASGKGGELRVVVAAPRGSNVKLIYEPKLKGFVASRSLPLGLTYPFARFIPGTEGGDGDPVDVIALHDGATYLGFILPCKAVGMVEIDETEHGRSQSNNRVIAMPLWNNKLEELEQARQQLPKRVREELAQFFLDSAFFTGKEPKLKGWSDGKAVTRYVKRAMVR